jgi:hypothetical protein
LDIPITTLAIQVDPEFIVFIFLAMIFIGALMESKTKIPYTIVLVIIGIIISFLIYLGFINNGIIDIQ